MEQNQNDLEFIQKLAELVKEQDLGEITIRNGDNIITIKGKKPVRPTAVEMLPTPAFPEREERRTEASETPATTTQTPAEIPSGTLVKAPIVGTFYAASAPDQPPFVKVGDAVHKGDVLFIIESMKLMNEVQSEVEGTVAEILVGNGEAVEYDQPVLRIL